MQIESLCNPNSITEEIYVRLQEARFCRYLEICEGRIRYAFK